MQFISYLIAGLLLATLNLVVFCRHKKLSQIVLEFIGFTLVSNIVSLCFFKYFMHKQDVVTSQCYTAAFVWEYVMITLMLGLVYLLIKAFAHSKIKVVKVDEKLTKKDIMLRLLYVVLFALGVIFIFFSIWFVDFFGELTPEQFLFNLKSPMTGTSSEMTDSLKANPLFGVIATTILYILFLGFKKEIYVVCKETSKKVFSRKAMRIVSCVMSIVICVGGVSFGCAKLRLNKVVDAYFTNSPFIKDNYHDPREVKLTFPEKKRNLVHIYLESVENSYLSKELGGHMDENLMPELTELAKEGIHFTRDKQFGGPHQTYGSSWSVASMMNMNCGIPLKIPMDGNSYGKTGTFLPGTVSLGDILDYEGYNQTVMFGADADFGGLTTFFTTHGGYNILDVKAAIKQGLLPEGYHVWWGYEDDKLFQFAKDELVRLDKEGKPFNLTMETADTHFPDGYLSVNAEKKYAQPYANAIAYSTKEAVKFIRWIQEQPFYENTTIVVTGDHLSMDTKFFEDFDPDYRRDVFNLILNAPITTTNLTNREFAPFDFFPTLLASMGVQIEGERLGLGTNLFSNEKTLIEQIGAESLETNLTPKSNFFNDEFIDESKEHTYKPKQ